MSIHGPASEPMAAAPTRRLLSLSKMNANLAVASLWVFYKLLRELLGGGFAVYAALLYFAICPWHITMSRWALESNLAPGFLLFGLYAFVLAARDSRYYMLSALFYGLSLYAYATIWVIVPFVILLQLLYLICRGRFRPGRYGLFALLILAILALPLILFMCVNYYEILDEIRTPIFSVPKLIAGRTNEIDFWHKRNNLEHMLTILSTGYDGWVHNASEEFGMYYRWGFFVGLLGFLYALIRCIVNIARKKYDAIGLVFPQFIMAVILGCLINVNINRINCIHIPIITFIGIGLYAICSFVERYFKPITLIVCGAMLVCFVSFEMYYYTEYRKLINWQFQASAEEKILDAMERAGEDETIYIDPNINYAKILYYSHMPVQEFLDTVEYSNYPYMYLAVSTMGRFVFDIENAPKDAIKVEMNY